MVSSTCRLKSAHTGRNIAAFDSFFAKGQNVDVANCLYAELFLFVLHRPTRTRTHRRTRFMQIKCIKHRRSLCGDFISRFIYFYILVHVCCLSYTKVGHSIRGFVRNPRVQLFPFFRFRFPA